MSAQKVDVLAKLRSRFEGCENGNYSNGLFLHPADARRIHDALAELFKAGQQMLPRNLCLENTNVKDDVEIPLLATMGELRNFKAALVRLGGDA